MGLMYHYIEYHLIITRRTIVLSFTQFWFFYNLTLNRFKEVTKMVNIVQDC